MPGTFAHRCPTCGGVYDITPDGITYDELQMDPAQEGIWRYRHTFGLGESAPVVTLGEGNTPLVAAQAFGRTVHFKLESQNPTGSFKDRLTAVEVSHLLEKGVTEAVEDSSGNAGASFAAYAARAGIRARIFVPDYASGPKRQQIEGHGAEVVCVPGPRSEAANAAQQAAAAGAAYASHATLPHGLAGLATLAYELVKQLGQAPGAVLAPAGHGSLLLGLAYGFNALKAAGVVPAVPSLVGVQAMACAPLWALTNHGAGGLGFVTEGETVAEGVRVRQPVRGDALLRLGQSQPIHFLGIAEEDILPGRDQLAGLGFYVEPTSAIVWKALELVIGQARDPVVAVLTGHGLKAA
ncbi:MAG: pyridoxal-phosphate dependent enzyme [Chloroflexi bacterium]|nr:pyridoxal-phosphate dependent enzyme [Chloroflexota bacterium]